MNSVYRDDFYNINQKQRFLKDLEEPTKKAYSRVLKRVSIMENKLDKDLYDFNLSQISQFLFLLKSTKISSLQQSGSIIKMYIDWAIEQDLRKDNINPIAAVASFEWYNQFVDNSQQLVFSEEDIGNVVDGCINFQDKVVIQGIFEGIIGRGNSELLNMKMEHITQISDGEYKIKLFNELSNGEIEVRETPISKYLYEIMRIADKEEVYTKNNGILNPTIKKRTNDLVDNNYIIRSAVNSRIKQEINDPSPAQLINRRVAKIAKWHNLPLLTIVNIRNSGMLKMGRDLYLQHGKFEMNECKIVAEFFNLKKDSNDVYNLGAMRAGFLNLETIRRVYKLEE